VLGGVVTKCDERGHADRDGVRPECQRLGDISAGADAPGDDELHHAMHPQLPQSFNGVWEGGQDGDAHVFDEHLLRLAGPDDLEIKIDELREITDWLIPI
jgi:hypothetical protein